MDRGLMLFISDAGLTITNPSCPCRWIARDYRTRRGLQYRPGMSLTVVEYTTMSDISLWVWQLSKWWGAFVWPSDAVVITGLRRGDPSWRRRKPDNLSQSLEHDVQPPTWSCHGYMSWDQQRGGIDMDGNEPDEIWRDAIKWAFAAVIVSHDVRYIPLLHPLLNTPQPQVRRTRTFTFNLSYTKLHSDSSGSSSSGPA